MNDHTKLFMFALADGCKILRTSCRCGGSYAWFVERDSGTLESYGCICHNSPPLPKALEMLDKYHEKMLLHTTP